MGRGSDDDAAARLALVRAATVTRSADDTALEEARVSTPPRERGDDVERFDPAAVRGARDGARVGKKSCPGCGLKVVNAKRTCPGCGYALIKKRRSE